MEVTNMALNDKKLQRLDQLLSAFDEGAVTPEELIQAIDAVMAIIDQNGRTLADKISETEQATDETIATLKSELAQTRSNLQGVINQVKQNADTSVSSVKTALLSEIKRVQGLIPVLPPETDLSEVFAEFETMRGELGNLSILIVGENIRNALESLQGDERLDKSAIKGLDELIEDITKLSKSGQPQAVGVRLLRYLSDVNIEGITNGQTIVWNVATQRFIPGTGGTGGGHTIEDEGTPLTQRDTLNFVGAGVTVTDAGGKTVVTIPGGGGVSSVVAGTGITVDDTDPANPIINATPSAGGISEELAIAYAVSL